MMNTVSFEQGFEIRYAHYLRLRIAKQKLEGGCKLNVLCAVFKNIHEKSHIFLIGVRDS